MQLPKSMKDWSVSNVCLWLEKIGMDGDVCQQFKRDKISGKALMLLNEEYCKEMKLALGDRIVIIEERDKYQKDPSCLNQELASEEMASASIKLDFTSVEGSECVSLQSERDGVNHHQPLKHDIGSHPFASLCSDDISSNAQHLCEPVAEKDPCDVERNMDIVYSRDSLQNQEGTCTYGFNMQCCGKFNSAFPNMILRGTIVIFTSLYPVFCFQELCIFCRFIAYIARVLL